MRALTRIGQAWRAFDGVAATARIAPGLAVRYLQSRIAVEQLSRLYDAAKASQYHPARNQAHSGDAVMDHAGAKLRSHARYLDENHDLAIGILDVLVNRTVGTGLTPAPMLRMKNSGELHEAGNHALERLHKDWARSPDSTGDNALPEIQRLLARSMFRDGEVLVQHMIGGRFAHAGAVPYTVELLEADYLPFELSARKPARIVHGVEKGAGGRTVGFHLLREHPGDGFHSLVLHRDTIFIPADRVSHLKLVSRLGQTRGVSIFHGVIGRLSDVKDYEESERIAARVAAAFTGYIKKGGDYSGKGAGALPDARTMEMAPGMIFDNLMPGEEVGTIGSNRPNPNLGTFVLDQVRRLAAGTGTGASSIGRNYSGNYSSQRQELVETSTGYLRMFEYFASKAVRPMWEHFVDAAILAGAFVVPRDVDLATLYEFECAPPATTWIDPLKEVKADAEAVAAGFKSRRQVIRERGGNVRRVDAELTQDDFIPATVATPAASAAAIPDDEEAQAA